MANLQNLRKTPVTGPAAGQPVGGGSDGATTFTKNAATGFFEANIDGELAVALPTDESGNAKAQLVPRTGLLRDLITLAGLPGEIAKPTDMQGVVTFDGTVGGARYVGNDTMIVPLDSPMFIAGPPGVTLNVPAGVGRLTLVPASNGQVPQGLRDSATIVFNFSTAATLHTDFVFTHKGCLTALGPGQWDPASRPALVFGSNGGQLVTDVEYDAADYFRFRSYENGMNTDIENVERSASSV